MRINPFFKSPKWSFKYFIYDSFENDFIRADHLQFSPISSCTISYSFYFNKRNVARAIYFIEKIFFVKPQLTFDGIRFNMRLSFSHYNFYRVFNLLITLLNSDKKKIIFQSQNDYAFTLQYNIRDLMSVFNIMSESFDYHSWSYATVIVFSFKNTSTMLRFKNFYLCATKLQNL